MIVNFVKWCEANNLPIPTTNENSLRTGVKPQYPDAYARAQYPDAHFAPISATAFLDLKNSKKTRSVKDVHETPLKK